MSSLGSSEEFKYELKFATGASDVSERLNVDGAIKGLLCGVGLVSDEWLSVVTAGMTEAYPEFSYATWDGLYEEIDARLMRIVFGAESAYFFFFNGRERPFIEASPVLLFRETST